MCQGPFKTNILAMYYDDWESRAFIQVQVERVQTSAVAL